MTERISAYRSHANDPLVFTDGGGLVWRVGEGHQPIPEETNHFLRGGASTQAPRVFTKCGNQYPSAAQTTRSAGQGSVGAPPPPHPRVTSAVNVSTYGWVYVW